MKSLSRFLRSAAPTGLLLLFGFSLPAALRAQVNLAVDATQTVRTVDEKVFGLNAVIWDGQTGAAQTIAMVQAAGVRVIRLPGGSLSDEYHWRTNKSLANTWTWAAGMDAFGRLVAGAGTQAFVTVNYGTGTPEEAAAWVAYANASSTLLGTGTDVTIGVDAKGTDWKTAGYWSALRAASPLAVDDGANFLRIGRASPFGIKFWEIGNECYGTWETDQQAVQWDPYTYAIRVKSYLTRMKAVDPTIKIGVVAVTGEDSNANNTSHPATNPNTHATHNGWTPVMLATLNAAPAATPDYLIYHRYEQAPAADQPNNPETDAGLLQKAKTWPADATDLRKQLTDYLGAAGAGVQLMVTENNSVYAKPGKQTTSLVNGLYLADSIGNVLQTEFNSLVWWDLRNGQDNTNNNSSTLYGWRNYGDYGVLSSPSSFGSTTAFEGYPAYYVMKLLANFARDGDVVVKATSSSSLLSVFSVRRTDGSLSLLVVNKDPANTLSANIALTGFAPGATATVYSYGKPQDTAAQTGSGSTDIATTTLTVSGASFSASFAPYSATVLAFGPSGTPVAPSVTGQPAARSSAIGQVVTFSATAGGNPAPALQWQRLPAGSTVWENLLEGGSYRGVTTGTLTIDATTAGMSGDQFRAVLSNASGSVTTGAAVLTVTGTSILQYPLGITRDPSGNLYVVDGSSNTVRKITPAWVVSTLAGFAGTAGSSDGTGDAARFNQPGAIASDADGNLYVADTGNATIRKVTPAGVVTTLAGSASSRGSTDGTGSAATFNAPDGIAVDSAGKIYVADSVNATIRKVTAAGVVSTLAGVAGSRGVQDGLGGNARFNFPNGIAVDQSGNLYVTDTYNNTVRKVTPDGTVTTLAGLGGVAGATDNTGSNALFNQPYGVTVDASGNLFVADTGNSTVRKVTAAGTVSTLAGLAGIAGLANGSGANAFFNQPRALVVDGAGNIYVVDTGNAVIRKIAADGTVSTPVLAEAAASPSGGGTTTPGSGGTTPPSNPGSSSGGGGGALGSWFVTALLLLGLGRRRPRLQ